MTSSPSDQSSKEREPKLSSQQIILLGILGAIFVIVMLTAIWILTRPQAILVEQTPVQTEIIISSDIAPSYTPTSTITPTIRPSFTPKPSRTPTVSPTPTITPLPTLPPSLTPAFPGDINDYYKIAFWTPELADQLIDLMEAYPETLSEFARGVNNQGYFDAFQYAIFAQQEALLRFSTAPKARDWLWSLAYNLARTDSPHAGDAYANLITQELNTGRVSLEGLYLWGLDRSPQVIIEVIPLETSPGDLSNSLVKVSAGENGSSFFWLLEKPNRFTSYPLTSHFNFIQPSGVDYFLVDQLGSNNAFVGIYPRKIYESLHYTLPSIFSLFQQPPTELPFEPVSPPAIGPEFKNNWEAILLGTGEGDLQFVDVVFPACPVTVRHTYEWNGRAFSFLQEIYEIDPDPELLAYCEIVIDHSLNVWGLDPTIKFMETLQPNWPPEETITGDTYPEDALDEWHYRLSLYHALLGNQEESIEYANTIISDPATPESRWIEPATDFLEAYQDQRDIYKACLPATFCDSRLAFQSLISTFSPQEFPDVINILEEAGVTIRSNGYFDFDNDGTTERWIVIRHETGSPLEFWIIYPTETNIEVAYVETVESDTPRITYAEPISEPPIVKIDPDITFHFIKQGADQEPVILMVDEEVIFSSDLTEMELDRLESSLLTGGDPAYVQQELIILQSSPYFTCSYLFCPRFLYLLGLASELANDEKTAVDTYLELWRNYIEHPYATMARFKLISTITPAPTLTPTNTQIASPTPIESFTPTPTEGTPTDTPTQSPTVSITPPTSTLTPTVTLTPEGYIPP
jgi:hypothetical protein